MPAPLSDDIAKRRAVAGQFVRFVVSGGVIAALSAVTYLYPAVVLHVPPLLANLLSYLVAVSAGFLLHSRVSFGGHGRRDRPALRVGRFVAVSLVSLGLNSAFVYALTGPAGLSPWWPVLPMATITPLVTFALNRQWVFA